MTTPNEDGLQPENFDETQRLAAYIPVTLTKRILEGGLPRPGTATTIAAATLFSDISGFTPMSEELAADGPRGAEEVNKVLLLTFTAMIDLIHEMGGAVSHFYGDAMSVYFPDEDGQAASRALSCAQQMQTMMRTSFQRLTANRPPNKNPHFALTIKIGVGYGRCQEILVGDTESSLEFVLTGTAVDEAAAAEKNAAAGEVCATDTVLSRAGFTPDSRFNALPADSFIATPAAPILEWHRFTREQISRTAALLPPFIPAALLKRIHSAVSGLAEHRPVTSLFVQFMLPGDEDDSSAIDSAPMVRELQKYYLQLLQIVQRFGAQNGRVNRILTADKGNQIHIIFGAPVAPDAPEQAVRCALALQKELADSGIRQKIGITVGKVFAGPVGSQNRREYTVVGDIVNLSARLVQVAEWGEILVDATVVSRVEQMMRFAPLPPMQLKGKQLAMTPYRLLRERSLSTRIQGFLARWTRPMVGRKKELALLQRLMDAALDGHGSAVGILGPIGVGKSRFIARGVEYWLERGGKGMMGVCFQHLSETAYAPWRDVWREFFGLSAVMSAAEQAAIVTRRTIELVPDVVADVGLWQELLGVALPQSEQLRQLDAEVRQKRLFALLRRCLRAALAKQPLLILVEGIHWADQTSLALLDELSQLTLDEPLLMLFSLRPEEKSSIETLSQPFCQEITIAELAPAYAREYLRQYLGPVSLPAVVEQQLGLRDREGRDSPVNPLFLEEALNIMLSAGIVRVNGRVTVNERLLAQMPLPDTIHGLLLARLDRLPPEVRDLLQVAAVIGRQFALQPLRSISGADSSNMIMSILNGLTEAELTRLLSTEPDWVYLFHHAMTHEVAYESMPYSRRQALHAAVARWLVEDNADNLQPIHPVLAYHYSRAGKDEEALRFAVLAGDDARAIFANREAVELYQLGGQHLEMLEGQAHWQTAVHLHLSLSEALRFTGDFNRAVAAAERAQQISEAQRDFGRMAACYNLLAELKCRQARFEEAEELTSLVTDELQTAVPARELARAYHWGGVAASSMGQFDRAAERLQQAETLCIQTEDNARLARVLESLAFIHYLQKNLRQALTYMQRGVALSRDLSHPANLASSLSNISLIQFQLGQAEDALETLDEAIMLARESSQNFLAQAIGNRAEILAYLGRFDDAWTAFDTATAMFMEMDDEESLIELLLLKGYEYHCVRQEWAEAANVFARVEQLISDTPERYQEFRARLLLGRALIATEQQLHDEAISPIIEAELLLSEKDSVWWLPVAFYLGSVIYQRLHIRPQAEAYVRKALEKLPDGGCPDYEGLIWLQLAQLQEGAARLSSLEKGVSALRRRSRYGDRAAALQAAAGLALATGEKRAQQLADQWRAAAEQFTFS